MSSKKWLLAGFVLIASVLYFMQDQWFSRDIDDYGFSTIMELVSLPDGSRIIVHDQPVNSLGDALRSQVTAYQNYNGRFLVHSVVQWFSGTKGDTFIAVANTLMWALMRACFVLLAFGRKRLDVPNVIVAFGVIWLLMPNAMKMYLGSISGTVNYLWACAGNLLVLLLYDRYQRQDKKVAGAACIAAALIALIVGSLQESFSIGIAAGLLVHALTHRKRLPRAAWAMVACYVIGTAICILAPSNFARADFMGQGIRWYVLIDLLKVPVCALTLLAVIILSFVRKDVVASVLKENTVIITAIVVNLVFAIFIAYTGAWQLTCISLLSAILLLQMYSRAITRRWPRVALACAAACCTIAIYTVQQGYRHQMWNLEQAMFNEARTSQDGIINMGEALEIDRPYSTSRLAPLYRQYLKNPFEGLITNEQLNGPDLLSKFLTRGGNTSHVTAFLPDSPEHIEELFEQQAETGGDSTTVALGRFTITRSSQDDATAADGAEPRQQWTHNGMHYRLYL